MKVLADEETKLALGMVNDRSLTVYTYNEEVVIKILKNLYRYNNLFDQQNEFKKNIIYG